MAASTISPFTVAKFLIGNAEAIRQVAASRPALGLAAAFVLMAALVRSYDRHGLTAQSWRLAIPFVASIAVAAVQFSCFWMVGTNDKRPSFVPAYRAFLTCFWMTAPVALFHAIPYERFLSPAEAIGANFWTLLGVSVWRGVIICRVLRVLAGASYAASLFVGLALGDLIAQVALSFMPIPVFNPMAGIERSPAVSALADIGLATRVIGVPRCSFWCRRRCRCS